MKGLILFIIFIILVVNIIRSILKNGKAEEKRDSARKPNRRSLVNVFAIQKRNEAWMEAAFEFELEYVRPEPGGYPSLKGVRRGIATLAEVEDNSSGMEVTACCAYFKTPFTIGLNLERDERDYSLDVSDSTMREFIKCGLRANSANLPAQEEFLTEKRRNALRNALCQYPYLELQDEYISLKTDGVCETFAELSKLIEFTVSLAELLENSASGKPRPASVRPATLPIPSLPPDFKVIRPEPEPPDIPSVPEPEPPQEPEKSLPPQEAVNSPGQKEFAEQLFSSSFPGQKEQEIFNTCKGREVEWEGALQSAYCFGSDYVLGSGPAVKAVFEIAEISGKFSMKTKIKAVIRLPEQTQETLKNGNGKVFRFSGRLEKFEPFAKEIILLDGKLL